MRRSTVTGLCVALAFGLAAVGATGALASGKPVITGLTVTPEAVSSGGIATVSATVSEATECEISANKTVAGLPVTFSCESGSVDREVVLPGNNKGKVAKYKLSLAAKGPGGKAKAHANVLVSYLPEPIFTAAGYDFTKCQSFAEARRVVMSGDGTSAVWSRCTFAFDGEKWVETAELPERGTPIAMSGDGLTLVMHYPAGIEVFVRSTEEEEWMLQATLTEPSDYPYSESANAELSADGNTLLIDGNGGGGLRDYERTGESWAQAEAPPIGGQPCVRTALSADGETALVDCLDVGSTGYVLAFVRSGSSWVQQGPPLVGSGAQSSEFGQVTLSADGNTALFGAPYLHKRQGEAWVFKRSGEAWSQQGPPITPPEKHTEKELGGGLALSADGNRALIAAPALFGAAKHGAPESLPAGSVYVYERSGESWTYIQALHPSTEPGAESGRWMALSENGDTAVISSYNTLHFYSG